MVFKRMGLTLCLLTLWLGTVTVSTAWGQLYSGSLTGVVTDPSGAVIPNANVTLTDIGKKFDYTAITDNSGRYTLRSLPPSTYTLTVEAVGFRTFIQDRIVLNVSQNATVDVGMLLGESFNQIEVSATAALLGTQDASTGQELDRIMINDLPLLGRGVFDLASLSPGVTPAAGYSNAGFSNNFISNGSRGATSDILMDGTSTTSFDQNTGALYPSYSPSVDSVQEFKIQQSNFSAEQGFSGSTIINMVTRSGTNQFHGSAWEFVRNNIMTANNWFANASGNKLAARHYNDFGGTVGGPIRKDKTFFFFNYEGVRDVNARTFTAGVPSAAMRTGDFQEICPDGFDAAGKCLGDGQLWDPYSGVYDAGAGGPVRSRYIPFNRIDLYQSPGNPNLDGTGYQLPARPGNLIDPVGAKIMQYFPIPNYRLGQSDYTRFENWFGTGSDRNRNDQFDLKIDHSFNDNNRLSAKYSHGRQTQNPANAFGNAMDANSVGTSGNTVNLVALNYTRTISNRTVLSVSLGYSRWYFDGRGMIDSSIDPAKELGLPEYMLRSGVPAFPAIDLTLYKWAAPWNSIGTQAWGTMRSSPETSHLVGTLSRLAGRHDLRIGGEGRMHRISFTQPGTPAGLFAFDQNGTSEAPWVGGDDLASLLTGIGTGSGWGQYEVPAVASTQSLQFSGYLQDNLKVSDKMTVNLGLRYDLNTPRTERYNRMSFLDPDTASPLKVPQFPNLKGVLGFVDNNDRYNYGWDKNNFSPRFGIAYRLTEKTVMRGGYGIFYSIPMSGAGGTGANGFQGFSRTTSWITSYRGDGATPWGRLSDPFPVTGPGLPPGSSLGGMSYVGDSINGPLRTENATPYEQTWTLGFQRELPGQVMAEANYVGKKGTHLYFAGSGSMNILGPAIEKYDRSQIEDLLTYVDNPFYGYVPDSAPLGGPQVPKFQLLLPYPQFSGFYSNALPVANSIYHGLQTRIEKKFSQGIQFLVTYTYSKSIDDASVINDNNTWLGGHISLMDPNNRRLERSVSQFDMPHVLGASYVWDLPVGRGKKIGNNWNPILSTIAGNWKTSGIWQFASGQPLALFFNGGLSLPTYGVQRPNLTGTLLRNTGPDFRDQYFSNPEVVVAPEPYAIANSPRALSSVRTPGAKNANMALFKEFPLSKFREGMRLEYRAEFFNAFNRPWFAGPDTTLDGGSFGRVTAMTGPAREVQMALKFYW